MAAAFLAAATSSGSPVFTHRHLKVFGLSSTAAPFWNHRRPKEPKSLRGEVKCDGGPHCVARNINHGFSI